MKNKYFRHLCFPFLTQFITKVPDIDEARVEKVLVLEGSTGVGVQVHKCDAHAGHCQLPKGYYKGAHGQWEAAEDALYGEELGQHAPRVVY